MARKSREWVVLKLTFVEMEAVALSVPPIAARIAAQADTWITVKST